MVHCKACGKEIAKPKHARITLCDDCYESVMPPSLPHKDYLKVAAATHTLAHCVHNLIQHMKTGLDPKGLSLTLGEIDETVRVDVHDILSPILESNGLHENHWNPEAKDDKAGGWTPKLVQGGRKDGGESGDGDR